MNRNPPPRKRWGRCGAALLPSISTDEASCQPRRLGARPPNPLKGTGANGCPRGLGGLGPVPQGLMEGYEVVLGVSAPQGRLWWLRGEIEGGLVL